jgi:hypothetical protein
LGREKNNQKIATPMHKHRRGQSPKNLDSFVCQS